MRKQKIVITLLVLVLLLCGCNNLSDRGKKLAGNALSYMHIAEYAKKNLKIGKYATEQDHYLVNLSDIADIDEISADVAVAKQDYTYFWIQDNSVQFWNDETKTEGILCAFDSGEALKDLKSWYKDVQTEKLADNCYLVRQARSWIG